MFSAHQILWKSEGVIIFVDLIINGMTPLVAVGCNLTDEPYR